MGKQVFEWLNAAYDDLRLVDKIINDENLTHLAAFHSQQTVEKSLKALLEHRGYDIAKIHSLNRLFKLCECDIKVTDYDLINSLDSLYVESRYPGAFGYLPYGKPSVEDAKKFYNFAREIYDTISRIVKD